MKIAYITAIAQNSLTLPFWLQNATRPPKANWQINICERTRSFCKACKKLQWERH
ncbi:hypothetical protein IWQ51_002086 [Labrenzia sp. EL_142]|nr:hypothetical protein [Labrenzia sp. EL_142]